MKQRELLIRKFNGLENCYKNMNESLKKLKGV